MKSYKTIKKKEVYRVLEKKYPEKLLPFVEQEDIPNNWLRMHGYTMHKRKKR